MKRTMSRPCSSQDFYFMNSAVQMMEMGGFFVRCNKMDNYCSAGSGFWKMERANATKCSGDWKIDIPNIVVCSKQYNGFVFMECGNHSNYKYQMNQKHRTALQDYNKFIKDEISMIENGARLSTREMKPKERELRNQLMQLVKQVSHTGELPADYWPDFKNLLAMLIKETLQKFNSQYKDCKTFEQEKEVVLQYMVFFDRAPFTLQRIVELTLEPEKYYKSCRKLLYAYEKLVNVADPDDR